MDLVGALSSAFVAEARPGLCMEGVVLRPLADGPVPAKELWRHARVSRRAMTSMRNAAVRDGLVTEIGDGAVSLATSLPPVVPSTCAPLIDLVSRFELSHPDFPITYGTADQSFRGGPGVDWKPIPRTERADELPWTALLSQALVAFGIEYEARGAGPIMWGASMVRGDHAGQMSGMERHGFIRGGDLTASGVLLRDAYAPMCQEIESSWRKRFGSSLIDEVIDAVRVDGGHSTFPWVRWTRDEFVVLGNDA